VLGSATPSIESYYKALSGQLELISLTKRVVNASLPKVKIVNMTKQLEIGNRGIFSYELIDAMDENLKRGKQTILFLNRRGHSNFMSCKAPSLVKGIHRISFAGPYEICLSIYLY
jgi:primosomal protein N' (replication factor Y)